MIDRISFACDSCGKTKLLEYSEAESCEIPSGWSRDEFVDAGYALDFCSKDCREKFRKKHPCLHRVPERRGPQIIPLTATDLTNELLRSIFGSAQQARQNALNEMSREFGVPVELVPEFGFHLQNTTCPKCKATAGEICRVVEGDDVQSCPYHQEEELKAVAHRERVQAAKKSWKAQIQ